jgi:metallo-beta-lactamase family protein
VTDVKLTFYGAAQEVTGSKYLLTLEAGTLLVECGLVQGRREESREQNRSLPRAVIDADACILTHAHIDHSGNLPTLVKSGFKGSIYATPATRDLCAHMLRDAARIQVSDAEYLNRKFEDDPHHKTIEPLYDEDDAIAALEAFVTVPYHKHFKPLPGVTATFLNAGHILGSSELVLDVEDNGVKRRIVFSGDLGRKGLPIIRDPERPPVPVDYLIMESTYGNRVHASVEEIHDDLERVIKETVARGGKVIVPAFAVGRTQELIFALNALSKAGRIPRIPVFIDSPLAINITEVFKLHPECFDAEARAFIEEHGDLFGFEGVQYMATKQDSISLNTVKGPAVIISASGMCEAGRVLHHLRNHVEDAKNTILIVGFMAQHTLGRRIVERRPRIKIWGVERDLRAKVEVLQSMSAHADRNDLLAFADACGAKTRRIFLVHGEVDGQTALKDTLVERGFQVTVPARGEVADLA